MRYMPMRLFSLLLLALPFAARAETDELLTWSNCLAYAQAAHPGLIAARESVEAARFDYLSTRSARLPTLDGNAGITRSETDDSAGSHSADRSSLGLDAGYTIYSGGADSARIAQSRAAFDSAAADWQTALADTGAELKRRFAALIYAQEYVALATQITARLKQNLDLVELRYDSGKEHKGSFLRTRASYRDAASDENRARRDLQLAQRQLATALGRSQFDVLIADGKLAAERPPAPDFTALLRKNPAHIKAEAQLAAAEASVRISRIPFRPALGARASYSRNGEDFNPENDAWSVGLALSFPFYAGGKFKNQLESARASARRASAALADTDNQTRARLEAAWTDLEDTIERRGVLRDYLEAALVRADIARNQYSSGLLSFDNWDQIEDDLINSQKSMLAGERDAVYAQAAWESAQGLNLFQEP